MSATASRASYEEALASSDPVERLRDAVAHDLQVAGTEREVVYQALDRLRLDLRRAGRETDEDAVMDVMDFVTGWCSPHRRL